MLSKQYKQLIKLSINLGCKTKVRYSFSLRSKGEKKKEGGEWGSLPFFMGLCAVKIIFSE